MKLAGQRGPTKVEYTIIVVGVLVAVLLVLVVIYKARAAGLLEQIEKVGVTLAGKLVER